jgi:hypothetical protein
MPIFKIYARASFEGPQPHIVRAGTANESHCWMYSETFRFVGGLEQRSHPTTKDIKEMWDAWLKSQQPRTFRVSVESADHRFGHDISGLTFDQALDALRALITSDAAHYNHVVLTSDLSRSGGADWVIASGRVNVGGFFHTDSETTLLYIEVES